MEKGFSQNNKIKKKLKMVSLVFLHFATTTHCNLKFWKIDPPYCLVLEKIDNTGLVVKSWTYSITGHHWRSGSASPAFLWLLRSNFKIRATMLRSFLYITSLRSILFYANGVKFFFVLWLSFHFNKLANLHLFFVTN